MILTIDQIRSITAPIAASYGVKRLSLFGSYARGDATPDSDVDVVVFGGASFRKMNILAFAEDLRQMTGKEVDAFEICELDENTPFYRTVMNEGRRIA